MTLSLVHAQQVVKLAITGLITITVKAVQQIVLHVKMILDVQVVLKERTFRQIHLGLFLVTVVLRCVQSARIIRHAQNVRNPVIIGA